MEAKRTKYFSIPVPHKPGELARFAKHMRDAKVNLVGLWGFGMGPDRAELLAIPENAAQFQKALGGTSWKANERTCFQLSGEDQLGALCGIADALAAAGVNLEAVGMMGMGGLCSGLLWCDEKDLDKVGKLLSA